MTEVAEMNGGGMEAESDMSEKQEVVQTKGTLDFGKAIEKKILEKLEEGT